jgi:hypothetical protein
MMLRRQRRRTLHRTLSLLFAVVCAAGLFWLAVSTMAAWDMSEGQQTVALAIGVPVLLMMVWGIWKESGR